MLVFRVTLISDPERTGVSVLWKEAGHLAARGALSQTEMRKSVNFPTISNAILGLQIQIY